jgi:hypothetical protein
MWRGGHVQRRSQRPDRHHCAVEARSRPVADTSRRSGPPPSARRQRSPGACVGAGISKTEAGAGYREDEQHFPRRVVAVADQSLGSGPGSRPTWRSVGFTGGDRQRPRTPIHRTALLVRRTRLQDRPTSSRNSRAARHRARQPCVEQQRARWTSRRPDSGGVGPAHRRPRTARDRGDTWGAGTEWSTGSATPEEGGPGHSRTPVPILNRRSRSSASRDG